MRSIRRIAAAALVLVAAGSSAACSSSAAHPSSDPLLVLPVPARVTVAARTVPGLGQVLVDGQGHALYMFPPDAGGQVTCTGPCAGTWPPLVIAAGHTPTAADGVRSTLLSTLVDPNTGARVVTYGGYPLYRYAGDVSAGTADGQALFLNGGPWYVLNTAGDPVTADPADAR